MALTKKQIALCKKALRYANEGTPIKDAFEHGCDEQDLFIALLEQECEKHRSV